MTLNARNDYVIKLRVVGFGLPSISCFKESFKSAQRSNNFCFSTYHHDILKVELTPSSEQVTLSVQCTKLILNTALDFVRVTMQSLNLSMFSHSRQVASGGDRMLPVFVFPNSLTFYADDQSQHKQVLTVYNPYEFGVRFKVLCTAPNKYIMAESEGVIRPSFCIDLVIRHNAISNSSIGVTDNFRIYMHEHGQRQLIGKKDVPATLLKAPPEGEVASAPENNDFQQVLPNVTADLRRGQQYSIAATRQIRETTRTNTVIILLALLCSIILMLPLQDDTDSHWSYFQPTVNLKLITAFFFGLIVAVIIKS